MSRLMCDYEKGELLKHSRKKLGLSQKNLADYLSIDNTLICRWEKGERPIPDKLLKVLKQVKRMNKKDAKSVKFSPDGKNSVGSFISNINLSIPLEEENTPRVQFQPVSGRYPENSMEGYILDAYITFKRSTGRFPTAGDFASGAFKEITQEEALEYFGSFKKTKSLAGELMRCQKRGYRKKEPTHTLKPISPRRNIQTAITYIDPNDEYNWLKALYPDRNLDTYKSKVEARNFTWKELFKYRPESERLVAQLGEVMIKNYKLEEPREVKNHV